MEDGGRHLRFVWMASGGLGRGCVALVGKGGLEGGRAMPPGIQPRGQAQRCSKEDVRATEQGPDQRLCYWGSSLRWLRPSLLPALGRTRAKGMEHRGEGRDAG